VPGEPQEKRNSAGLIVTPNTKRGYKTGFTFKTIVGGRPYPWRVYNAPDRRTAFVSLLYSDKVLHFYRSGDFLIDERDVLDPKDQERIYAGLAFARPPKPYTRRWLQKHADPDYEPYTFLGQVGKNPDAPGLTKINQTQFAYNVTVTSKESESGMYPRSDIARLRGVRTYLEHTLFPVAVINPSDGSGTFLYDDPLYGRITYKVLREGDERLLRPFSLDSYLLHLCMYQPPRENDLVVALEHGLANVVGKMLHALFNYADLDALSDAVKRDARAYVTEHPEVPADGVYTLLFFRLRRKPESEYWQKVSCVSVRGFVSGACDEVEVHTTNPTANRVAEDLFNRLGLVPLLAEKYPPTETPIAYGMYTEPVESVVVRRIPGERYEIGDIEFRRGSGSFFLFDADFKRLAIVGARDFSADDALRLYREGFLKALRHKWIKELNSIVVSKAFYV